MNLDEMMEVWKSQDASPLHDVNKALLHQALRQEDARLQKARRKDRWMRYAFSALVIGIMGLFLAMMISARQRYVLTGWDYVAGIGGAVAAVVAGAVMYVGHRAQVRREQRFGESLRDQINRRIAQLDDAATGARRRRMLANVLLGVIVPLAILHLGMRFNHKTLSDARPAGIILCILCFLAATRTIHRTVQQAISRKRDLEKLLKELDGQ